MGWQKKRNITQDYEVKCVKENPNGLQAPNLLNEAGPGYVQHRNIDLSLQKQTKGSNSPK